MIHLLFKKNTNFFKCYFKKYLKNYILNNFLFLMAISIFNFKVVLRYLKIIILEFTVNVFNKSYLILIIYLTPETINISTF